MGNIEDSLINRKIDGNGVNSDQGIATAVLGNSSNKLENKQDNQSASKRNSFSGKGLFLCNCCTLEIPCCRTIALPFISD